MPCDFPSRRAYRSLFSLSISQHRISLPADHPVLIQKFPSLHLMRKKEDQNKTQFPMQQKRPQYRWSSNHPSCGLSIRNLSRFCYMNNTAGRFCWRCLKLCRCLSGFRNLNDILHRSASGCHHCGCDSAFHEPGSPPSSPAVFHHLKNHLCRHDSASISMRMITPSSE